MGLMFKIAGAVALLAVVLVLKPELVLHLPNGFIAYAILGNPPPGYFMYDAWKKEEFDTWAKDGDLVVAVGGKCGTNWLLYMTHLIRVKANIEEFPYSEILEVTPWPSLRHFPGQKWSEVKEGMNSTVLADGTKLKDKWDNPKYPFRIFKSHETPDDVPKPDPTAVLPVRSRRGVKFLAAVRNPYDQLRSLYPFFASHSPRFRRMWGDFPPVYSNKDEMMADFLDGGVLGHLVWGYPNVWFPYRDESNVLLLSYDQILKDPKGHVEKLAKFLEVELTPQQVEQVVKLSSFTEMKKISSKFNYNLWGHPTPFEVMEDGKLLRAGKAGQGQEFFTHTEKKRISEHIEKEFSAELRQFLGV